MKKILVFLISILLILSIGYWIKRTVMVNEIINKINTMPIYKSLNISDSIAKEWNEDSYLVYINLDFCSSNENVFVANYESPNEDRLAYSVWIFNDGTIDKSIFRKNDISIDNAISKRDNWLESSELLERIFKSVKITSFIRKSNFNICGFMEIYGKGTSQEDIFWRVLIENRENPIEAVELRVNPNTGKLVDFHFYENDQP